MGIKFTCDGCGKENKHIIMVENDDGIYSFIMPMVNNNPWVSKCVAAHEHGDHDSHCEFVVACSPKCSEQIDRRLSERAKSHLSVVRPPVEKS